MNKFLLKSERYEDLSNDYKEKADFLEKMDIAEKTKGQYWRVIKNYIIPYEKNIKKLLYEFTDDDISNLISSVKKTYKSHVYTIINSYCELKKDGYSRERFGNLRIQSKDDTDNLKWFKKLGYLDLDNFYEILDDLQWVSDVDRLFICMTRYGIPISDILQVTEDCIDYKNLLLKVNKICVKIDSRFIDRVNRAKECEYFEQKNGAIKEYKDTGFLIKSKKNTEFSKQYFDNHFKDLRNKTRCKILRPQYLRYSRVIDLMKEYRVNTEILSRRDIEGIIKNFGISTTTAQLTTIAEIYEIVTGDSIMERYVDNSPKESVSNELRKELEFRDGRWQYPRSEKVKLSALEKANYKCEYKETHPTFISGSSNKPYVHGHHLIPVEYNKEFKYNIDCEENIVCICVFCHELVHHGTMTAKKKVLRRLYDSHIEGLRKKGLEISFEDLLEMYK